MAVYRLLAPHVIDGALRPRGDIVEFCDDPTPDMEPLDAEARGRFYSMPWALRGWKQEVTAESLPGGRFKDGSPVLLNRPENMGRPLTYNPPQPNLRREIPEGTARERIVPRHPPRSFYPDHRGSLGPHDPLLPFGPTPGSKGA